MKGADRGQAETCTLVIGQKNYSSWSMRAWLLLKMLGMPFTEVTIPLYRTDSRQAVRALGGQTGLVPVLIDCGTPIWDNWPSLSISTRATQRYGLLTGSIEPAREASPARFIRRLTRFAPRCPSTRAHEDATQSEPRRLRQISNVLCKSGNDTEAAPHGYSALLVGRTSCSRRWRHGSRLTAFSSKEWPKTIWTDCSINRSLPNGCAWVNRKSMSSRYWRWADEHRRPARAPRDFPLPPCDLPRQRLPAQ